MTPEPRRQQISRSSIFVGVALSLLVADRTVQMVRSLQDKPNGHSEVRPQDAIEFFTLQKNIERDGIESREEHRRRFDLIDARLERIEARIK